MSRKRTRYSNNPNLEIEITFKYILTISITINGIISYNFTKTIFEN